MATMFRKSTESYKGRNCGCAPGTQEALVGLVSTLIANKSRVLDLGAHSGALLLRLSDAGFKELHAADLDRTRFDVPGAALTEVDLNTDFTDRLPHDFDLVTATEMIEHLDSPRDFLARCRALVHDTGLLAISLPNVAYFEGRIKFMLKGELWGFGDRNYRIQRHISPLTFEQLTLMLQEVGWKPVACATAGSFATPLRRIVTFPFWGPIRLFGGPTALGESAIVIARKADPDPELRSPLDYRRRWAGIPDDAGLHD